MKSIRNPASPLFDFSRPGVSTAIGGLSHAVYEQHTRGSRHIHHKILAIFDHFGLEYYLFAGSMVGFVRNRAMPQWMDDLDVLVFDDQIEKFEAEVVPYLRKCGFNCFAPKEPYDKGGYHVLALQSADWNRQVEIPLTGETGIKVPWAQVDVFFAQTDADGFVRSPSAFGLFHKKDIPESWVKPGVFVEIEGVQRRVFSEYVRDIYKEYGDVLNEVVVATHDKVFLQAKGIAWQTFEDAFNNIVRDTTCALPPNVSQGMVRNYAPVEGILAEVEAEASLDAMLLTVLERNAAEIAIAGDTGIFWVMDLKRILPALKIRVSPVSQRGLQRAAHLVEFIDRVVFAKPEDREEFDEYVRAIKAVIRTGASGFAPDLAKYVHGRLIAHAGGICEGRKYTNSLEAFEQSRKSVNLIELDICDVSDGLIVAHDGLENRYGISGKFIESTLEEFTSSRFDGALTPVSVRQLLPLLKSTETRIVCDIKTAEAANYQAALDEIRHFASAHGVMDNIIIQVYNPEDHAAVVSRGFRHYILALWKFYGNVRSEKAKACIDHCFSGHHDGFRALSIDKIHFLKDGKWAGDEVARYMFSKSPMVFVHGQQEQHEEMFMRKGFGLFSHNPEKLFWLTRQDMAEASGSQSPA